MSLYKIKVADHPHYGAQRSITTGDPAMSTGTVTTNHITAVNELLRVGDYWTNAINGKLTPQETGYFDLTYQLFHDGMLKGIEVGLPFPVFMAAVLGCSTSRFDEIFDADPRIAQLRCPANPNREMTSVEHAQVTGKLECLEHAMLFLQDDVLRQRLQRGVIAPTFAAPESARNKRPRSSPSPDQHVTPGNDGATAPQFHPNAHKFGVAPVTNAGRIDRQGDNAGIAPGTSNGMPPRNGAVVAPHASSEQAGRRGCDTQPSATATNGGSTLATTSGHADADRQRLGPVPSAVPFAIAGARNSADYNSSSANQVTATGGAAPASGPRRDAQRSLAPPTRTVVQGKRKTHIGKGGVGLGALSKSAVSKAAAAPAAAPARSRRRLDGPSLGRMMLGLGHLQQTKPRANKNGGTRGSRGTPQADGQVARRGGDSTDNSVADGETGGGATRKEAPLPVLDPGSEEVAAIEYLKWELHGKFMAFPGEHYDDLVAHLATAIYHYRYPVEHGVDILQGVMRAGAPDAVKACAATLKHWNSPDEVSG